MIDIWEHDFDLIEIVQDKFNKIFDKYDVNSHYNGCGGRKYEKAKFTNCDTGFSKHKKKRLASRALKRVLNFEKGYIPEWIWSGNEKTQWEYIKGLYYADGTINITKGKGQPCYLSLCSIDKEFLEELQILLANLGINTAIGVLREEGFTSLPDGHGGKKEYLCKKAYRLTTGNKNDVIEFEKNTGFLTRKGKHIEIKNYRDNTKKFHKIKSIEYIGKEDVYCCKVDSKEHLWICNGFITHNCSEIWLPSSETESFVCDLSSMNILYYDDWKNTNAVELLVYFLDAVMTEFIEKAKKIKFMERAVRFAERHRALGIGWLGWHSYLQSKMIPFESMEAKYKNTEIAKNIKQEAYSASQKMAEEYGEPEILKNYNRRHTTLLAIAPTKSSAFILGQVSEGIEPHRTNYYIKDLQKGKFTIKNVHLQKLLKDKNLDTDEIWDDILKHGGSVQHLDCLTENEKDVFKTFGEISQKEIIIQAAARQKYIDQGQSLNLMIHPSISTKDINNLIIDAWKLGCKALYYQISVNAAQQFSRNILTCKSCE